MGDIKEQLGPPPAHIVLLKNDSSGKTYVVNEVLNYYQCKTIILTKLQTANLPHHSFGLDKLEEGKQILLNLWNWKNLIPSSPLITLLKTLARHAYVVKLNHE